MTIGDFLDKHFWHLWWLALAYIGVRFIGIIVVRAIGNKLDN
jgi:hypothetical protein